MIFLSCYLFFSPYLRVDRYWYFVVNEYYHGIRYDVNNLSRGDDRGKLRSWDAKTFNYDVHGPGRPRAERFPNSI